MVRAAPLLVVAASLPLLFACGERGGAAKRPGRRDASALRAVHRDAAPPVAPRATAALVLGQGCSCEAVPSESLASHEAARRAAVARLDAINEELRRAMEALDGEAGNQESALGDPVPHARRLEGLTCRLDCLLHQFLGFTPPAWDYLEQLGRFLDRATVVLGRLARPPKERPAGPGMTELTASFNDVARLSNHTIGLALLAPAKVERDVGLDSLAFGAKTRRQAAATAELVKTRLAPWLGEPGRPTGQRIAAEPRTCRVALARLRQELGALLRAGRALKCERGTACATLGPRWAALGKAGEAIEAASMALDEALRRAGGQAPAGAAAEALSKPLAQAKEAWDKARAELPTGR